MQRITGERGAALILLMGITATLFILTAALVMLLANQQRASANSREDKNSLYFAEAALDSGVNAIKATTVAGTNFPTTGPTGVVMTSMNTEYAVACPLPAPSPTYNVYDNAIAPATVDTSTHWDANLDHKVWVEAKVTYLGHTSRLRQMLDSSISSSILPEAALYADTDIIANDTSNVYAVKPDGTFYTAGVPPYVTSIMAGDDLTGNSATTLSALGQSPVKQTLGLNVNGTISLPGVAENGVVTPGTVGLLSDYFNGALQYALTVEAQTGMNVATYHPDLVAVPTAPTKPTSIIVAATQFTPANLTAAYLTSIGASFNSGTKTYTFGSDLQVTGNLALNATTFPTGTIFNFQKLYVNSGTFIVTGNVTVTATTLYVGGALTISGASNTITDSLGALYVTGATAVSGSTALTTTSVYSGGTFTHTGPASPAISDGLGPFYSVGTATFSGNVNVTTTNVHAGSGFTITAPTGTTTSVADSFGALYVVGTAALSGNAVVDTTHVYTGANFTISGSTANITDQFGPVFVTGTADWNCGSLSARLRLETTCATATTWWLDPAAPAPMFAQILTLDGDTNGNYDANSGPYDLVFGDVWVDGNAGTGNVAVNFSAPTKTNSPTASTIMCTLLATTEKTVTNGYVNIGTLNDPMVYYMQCDNDQLYSNTCQWASTGTFTGLAIIMEAALQISGGNDGTHPNFVGSVMVGTPSVTDITLSGNSSVCYNQKAIDNLPTTITSILRTTTTATVPGTWQQLPAN